MSPQEMLKAMMSAGNGGNTFVFAPVNITIHVDSLAGVPDLGLMDVFFNGKGSTGAAEKQAIDPAQGANPEVVDQMMADDRNWQTPDAEKKLLAEVMASAPFEPIKGNLTHEKLVERMGPENEAAANRLWSLLGNVKFRRLVAKHGAPLEEGKRGGYLMSSVRKAVALEELVPGCMPGYDEELHEWLQLVTVK